jgi:hypothetical protein
VATTIANSAEFADMARPGALSFINATTLTLPSETWVFQSQFTLTVDVTQ